MQKQGTAANPRLAVLWAVLIAAGLLLPGCAANGDGAGDWSLLPDTDAELAEAVQDDPFPTAAELGIASAGSR